MEEAPEVRILKFGNENAHDVILEVGNTDFHVSKGLLSAQSHFFYALFNSDFKEKNENRVNIEADENAFESLMEIVFNLRLTKATACPSANHICEVNPEKCVRMTHFSALNAAACIRGGTKMMHNNQWAQDLWKGTMDILELAERFQMVQMGSIKKIISDRLKEGCCGVQNCVNCALNLFLRSTCKMIEPSDKAKTTKFAFERLFDWYSDSIGIFQVTGDDMKKFVKMINLG